MSDPYNPYAFTPAASTSRPERLTDNPRQPLPGGVIAVCVICIVLALFGLLGSCSTFASPLLLRFSEQMISTLPESDRAAQQAMIEDARRTIWLAILISAINLFIGGGLVWGAIGCLTRKMTGRNTLRIALIAASTFVALRFFIQSAVYVMSLQIVNQNMPENVRQDTTTEMIFNLAIGGVIGAGLVTFYVVSFLYLGKPSVRSCFSSSLDAA